MKGTYMERKNVRRRRLVWVVASVAGLLLILGGVWVWNARTPVPDKLYLAAVADAVDAEPDEIEPLVELTQSDLMTTWDSQGRVLLLSWNDHPDQFPEGEDIRLDGEIWTFTDREIAAWYAENKDGVKDWDLRLEQLIGLPPDAGYTHMSGFWVEASDVVRPAYVTDVTEQMQLTFPAGTDPTFEDWFEGNSKFSYEESAYPWTRLGYTYDWADNGTEYGLTEFLVEADASVQVAFTETTADFLAWLEDGAAVDKIA